MEQNDGMITLIDGSVIQGYTPQRIADQRIDNSMELDTTGEYFALGGRNPSLKHREGEEGREFFTDNAFFFLKHAKEILADSRMFLARVPVVNGMAYTGTSGFRAPTLGVYLEWWSNCPDSVLELDGEKWLVWFISGSPLSGSNACAIVNEKGETKDYNKLNFTHIWTSFTRINTRYDRAKVTYACYTLAEVVNILRDNDDDKEKRDLMLDFFFLRSCNRELTRELQVWKHRYNELGQKYVDVTIRLNIDAVKELHGEYLTALGKMNAEKDVLRAQRLELRKQLKSGELESKEYQRQLRPISKRLKDLSPFGLEYELGKKLNERNIDLTSHEVIDFFNKEEAK